MRSPLLVLALFLIISFAAVASAVDTAREFYAGPATTSTQVISTNWRGQSFTVGNVSTNTAFNVSSVGLQVIRSSADNSTFVVGIRAVDSSGLPTGADIANGTLDTSAIVYNADLSVANAVWKNITFTITTTLNASTKYAIVARMLGTATVELYLNDSNPNYAGGNRILSSDSGGSWSNDTARDHVFYVYTSAASTSGALTVFLDNPANDTMSGSTSVAFNATVNVTNLNITNATIYVWNNNGSLFNRTTNTLTGNLTNRTYWNISSMAVGSVYFWNVFGCGSNSTSKVCAFSSSNYTLTISPFSNVANYSSPSVFETTYQPYNLNISVNPSVLSGELLLQRHQIQR